MGLKITRLIFMETGTYGDMALRPYTSHVTAREVAVMQEATRGGVNFNPTQLAGVAGSIIRPATDAAGIVSIANGWGEKRLRFFMEVASSAYAGAEVIQYFTGYTDYLGLTGSGAIDPAMRLFFNNAITTRRTTELTPFGNQTRSAVSDASQVLYGENTPNFRNLNKNAFTMRPEDIFTAMGSARMIGDDIVDTRQSFAGSHLKKSRRSNAAPTSYLSRVMTAHSHSVSTADIDEDFQTLMSGASSLVKENLISQDPTLSFFMRETSLNVGSSVTYGELCASSPGLDNIVVVGLASDVVAVPNHQRGESEYWTSTTNEAVFCTILSHSVPAIMMDLMLQKVEFLATNQTLNGQFHIQFGPVMGLAQNVDLTPYIQQFSQRLQSEILQDLTANNEIDINLNARFDVLGETWLDISIGGGPMVRFVTPSFCDALMTPVLTNDADFLKRMAFDVDQLASNMSVNYSPQNTYGENQHVPRYSSDTV